MIFVAGFARRLDKRLAAFKNWAAFADASYSRVNRDPVWYHIGSYDPLKVKARFVFRSMGFSSTSMRPVLIEINRRIFWYGQMRDLWKRI
jgi:hypothetical protein